MNDLVGTTRNILGAALIAGAAVLGCAGAFAQQRQPVEWTVPDVAALPDDAAIALYTRLGTREDVLHFDIPPRPHPSR